MIRQYLFQSSEGCGGFTTCITLNRVIEIYNEWLEAAQTNQTVNDFIDRLPEKDQIVDAMGSFGAVLEPCNATVFKENVNNKFNFDDGGRCNKFIRMYFGIVMTFDINFILDIFNKKDVNWATIQPLVTMYFSGGLAAKNIKTVSDAFNYNMILYSKFPNNFDEPKYKS